MPKVLNELKLLRCCYFSWFHGFMVSVTVNYQYLELSRGSENCLRYSELEIPSSLPLLFAKGPRHLFEMPGSLRYYVFEISRVNYSYFINFIPWLVIFTLLAPQCKHSLNISTNSMLKETATLNNPNVIYYYDHLNISNIKSWAANRI